MESEQDRKTYRENGKNTGISLGYDIPSGKASGFASAGKSRTDSHYESVTNQAGIYAGDKGFDITVKDNTHLKGAVIDSKGSAEKNTLRTGTLIWEDVENKADYKAGGMGISYAPKDSTTPLNARGLTPQMSPTVKDKADSSTKAAISKGTIVIMDKKNQNQDISTLNRDTQNSLNKLKEIFDKSKVKEKQELLGMMEKYGNQAIHAYAESRGWKDGSAEKVLLHGAFGALMGDMGTGETLAGALSGSIHEYVMGYLNRTKSPEWVRNHPDTVEWLSAGLGAVIGKVSDASISGMAGISLEAAKWNSYGRETRLHIEKELKEAKGNRRREKEIKEELYFVNAIQRITYDDSSDMETVKARDTHHRPDILATKNLPVFTLPGIEVHEISNTPEYINRAARSIAKRLVPGIQVIVNGAVYDVTGSRELLPAKNKDYDNAWKVDIQKGTLSRYEAEHKEDDSFNPLNSAGMALISDEIGKPWTEMYKHGVRGPWGALGKYNAVGNAVGGIVDITGDFNTYSGKDLGIAVGIDTFKLAFGILGGALAPVPGIVISVPLDYGAYWIKQNLIITDKQKQKRGDNKK